MEIYGPLTSRKSSFAIGELRGLHELPHTVKVILSPWGAYLILETY